ncbi:hypothetical protein DFH07DRAFT_1020457 [Mycena maculata]|uniref:F-box domain-containing protein n=1 Tax=Mycena maculata TaxID=230809 RepID=A0AAD7NI75_9AGAR|nr:hypothetical protein DFH07DRAFT_1020457 [Mycena maculata]
MHLPEELVCAILAKLFYKNPPFSTPDYTSLSACSLVNSMWTGPAQTLLFKRITLEKAPAFAQLVFSTRNTILLTHVRTLAIALSANTLDSDNSVCQVSTLISILEHCPRLYELSVSARALFSLGSELTSSIAATTAFAIRALRLMECSVQSPILYELLTIFPRVQFLTLGVEIAASPPTWTLTAQLYELTLHRTPSSDVLVWLLSSSGTSLRVLELRDLPSARTQSDLGPCCPHIQSLRLMRYDAYTAAILRRCTNLIELVLLNVPPLVSLPALPPSLEHFALLIQTYTASVDLQPVIVAVDTLPRLRILSFIGDGQLEQIPRLRAACDAKGIAMWTTLHKFWINDDPVIASHFPRRRQSVSNFYLMN